jgi:tryptophan synthase alpha chain
MSTPARCSIKETFTRLRAQNHIAFMPFVPAGYPDLRTTELILPALEAAGANIIEIGIPFSDPIADGPVVQEAFTAALARGLKLADIFDTIRRARPTVSLPLIAMVSFSVVFRHGIDQFIADASQAGFDGLILPDLPPPEAETICARVRAAGLDTILLVAPSTSMSRRQEIARLSSGFIYYLSVMGITGERDKLPAELSMGVANMKGATALPVCVGFGIYQPKHVKQLAGVADGAIVGSAIVKRMKENQARGPEGIAESVAAYCRELLSEVR